MAIVEPCYCSRSDVKTAPDFEWTGRDNTQLDRAIQSAARTIERRLHRRFYPEDDTRYLNWPNYQYAWPWRIYLERNELADQPTTVTSGGQVISSSDYWVGNGGDTTWSNEPPYTFLELNRASSAAFGGGDTPQRSVAITGPFGYSVDKDPVTTLAAALTDTTSTTLSIARGGLDAGDILIIDSERMLVTDRAMADTAIAFAGLTTANTADNTLAVPDGTAFSVGEVLLFDTERCLITDIAGNTLVLKRAWGGTVLAAHTSGTIWAERSLTVTRAALGTTAATHSNGATIYKHRVPSLVRDLAVALAENQVLQETSGYARIVGEGPNARPASGRSLAEKWNDAIAAYGRKARLRTV